MSGYTYVWEFYTTLDKRLEFERCYGAAGVWSQLFQQADGYIETILLQDNSDPLRYVTIDRWESIEAYKRFRANFARLYSELDDKCHSLTVSEHALGQYSG